MADQSKQDQHADQLLGAALRLASEVQNLCGKVAPGSLYRLTQACSELEISRVPRQRIRRALIESGHLIINGSAESVFGQHFHDAMIKTSK